MPQGTALQQPGMRAAEAGQDLKSEVIAIGQSWILL